MSILSTFKIRVAALAALLAMIPMSPMLRAESLSKELAMRVPFGFQVGANHFAAGVYTMGELSQHILKFQGASGYGVVISEHEANAKPLRVGKAVFHRYGDQYFLREVWTADSGDHLVFYESKAERQAEKSELGSARASAAIDTDVEIALLEPSR
jgi:hypothetical protein